MDALTARPKLLKQANLSSIRKVIKARGTATRAEIAREIKTSSTTVRSLLTEMMQNGEIESVGYDESSGGRKAERYCFQSDRYFGVAFCIAETEIHALLIDVYGEIVKTIILDSAGKDYEQAIIPFLDDLVLKRSVKAIGIGVPGIVEGNCFWRGSAGSEDLTKIAIGETLAQRYSVPVVMENDLNATAIGFGRCYAKEFPCDNPENTNMAYLHFEKDCVSAGFIVGGRVVRGSHNFAGELGLIPIGGDKLLNDRMSASMDDKAYVNFVVEMISWICGILNPQYVTLGGPNLRKDCLGPIGDGLSALLPKHMYAEILYAPDVWQDYHDGMAYLTAGKMFDEIQFVQE